MVGLWWMGMGIVMMVVGWEGEYGVRGSIDLKMKSMQCLRELGCTNCSWCPSFFMQ